MFECNGYIYASIPDSAIKIEKVKMLDDMIMLITFSNGETRLFDATILEGPVFEPLKNGSVFKNCIVEHGVATWNNGDIDCAPEYMYEHSYEYAHTA